MHPGCANNSSSYIQEVCITVWWTHTHTHINKHSSTPAYMLTQMHTSNIQTITKTNTYSRCTYSHTQSTHSPAHTSHIYTATQSCKGSHYIHPFWSMKVRNHVVWIDLGKATSSVKRSEILPGPYAKTFNVSFIELKIDIASANTFIHPSVFILWILHWR